MTNPFKQIRGNKRRLSALGVVVALAVVSLAWHVRVETPRARAASEVPVAFWAWHDDAPAEAEVERAAREGRARALFLRAGQFDLTGGRIERIRAAGGRLPRTLPLHLVYNTTRGLLAEFERTDEGAVASAVAETFRQDLARASKDGAQVAGLQLDFDVPTRLLPRYERVLRGVRGQLPQGAQLSVTGLPTWMQSSTLGQTLDAVDFWTPQCYGATIPERIEDVTPISSPELVASCVARARRAGRPFYAGLAAYGYAILYDTRGALVELRGDLDPASVARNPNFELLERRPFPASNTEKGVGDNDAAGAEKIDAASSSPAVSREWRYVYRALGEGIVDNLPVRAGDRLVLDVPSAETLRATARAAREQGGAQLSGLCIFRLPGEQDPTTLTLPQVIAAINDAPARTNTDVRIERVVPPRAGQLRVEASNDGEAGALFGDDALTVTLRVPAGSVRGVVSMENVAAVESLCGASSGIELQPCSMRRADTLRLRAATWQPGANARAVLSFDDGRLPSQLPVRVAVRTDDGRAWQSERLTSTQKGTSQ